jgi:hypothetical protein
MDKYTVYYKGEPKTLLNQNLVKRQGIDDVGLDIIKSLHNQKFSYLEKMEGTDDPEKLKELAQKIEEVEFRLQKEWKFPLSKNYHRWFDVPKCTCPKLDNADYIGTDYRIITPGCPVHT